MDRAQRLKQICLAREYALDEPQAVGILEREMKSTDAVLRTAAAEAVCDYYHVPALVHTCMELARKDVVLDVRERAIHSLGYILEDGTQAGLEDGADEADPEELDRETFRAVKGLLFKLARDSKGAETIGCSAVEALGWLGDRPEVTELLEEYYARPEPRARASALIGAGRANAREWEGRVLEALNTKSGPLLHAALRAVASLGLRKAATRVQDLCSHSHPDVRNAAILAVPTVLSARRANRLLKSLRKHKDPDTRRMVRSAKEILEEESLYGEGDEDAVESDSSADASDEDGDEGADRTATARERAAILDEFVESVAFGKAPADFKPWLPMLTNHFFDFLQEHQGIDVEEFEPSDLADFLLEFLPVNLDLPPGAAEKAPEGLAVLVRFMVESRRFSESASFCESLSVATPDYLLSIGDPTPGVGSPGHALTAGAGWRDPTKSEDGSSKPMSAGSIKAHAHRVDGKSKKNGANGRRSDRPVAGAGGRPATAPAHGSKCPCGSGKSYGKCCGGGARGSKG